MDPYVNILFGWLHISRLVDWSFVNIADLAKTPPRDISEIIFSNLDSVYE
jgi:hypothetical protein